MSVDMVNLLPWERFNFVLHSESMKAMRYMYFFSILIIEIYQIENSELLPVLGDLIFRNIRDSDLIGEDERQRFLLLLHDVEITNTFKIGQRIKDQVKKQNLAMEGKESRLTVSIGGACFPTDSTDPKELFMAADNVLQKAKSLWRNREG